MRRRTAWGGGISYDPVEATARVTERYVELCREAGWEPGPDQIVYRGGICLAETDGRRRR